MSATCIIQGCGLPIPAGDERCTDHRVEAAVEAAVDVTVTETIEACAYAIAALPGGATARDALNAVRSAHLRRRLRVRASQPVVRCTRCFRSLEQCVCSKSFLDGYHAGAGLNMSAAADAALEKWKRERA